MKRPQLSKTATTLILEVFSIVLGISLAFFVNEWRETNADNEKAQAALQSLQHEVQSNLEQLVDALPKHEAFRDSLRVVPHTPEPLLRRVMRLGGLSSAGVTSASWEAALASNATAAFDYELLRVMALIHEFHASNGRFVEKFTEVIYSPDALSTDAMNGQRVILSIILTDWIIAEQALVIHYEQALTLLEEALD